MLFRLYTLTETKLLWLSLAPFDSQCGASVSENRKLKRVFNKKKIGDCDVFIWKTALESKSAGLYGYISWNANSFPNLSVLLLLMRLKGD